MARTHGRLTALAVSRAKAKGLYADGAGLYLQVTGAGARSWIFRYRMNGRKTPRDMGLGSLVTVSLAEARQKAAEARKAVLEGKDPIDTRRNRHAAAILDAAKSRTFEECATAYIASHKAGWRNPKHADQWPATLNAYAYPSIGQLPIQAIDVGLVLKVLEPIWTTKTETASRLRGRIEAVLDWAAARGYRTGDNPARWRGRLENLLPPRSRVRRIVHHPALPYADIGKFVHDLRAQEGIAARALEFLILTATRTSEAIGARWDEIDFQAKLWTIPAERIKAGRAHRVPLSVPTLAVLKQMRASSTDTYVFPGGKRDRPLSTNALLALLKRMNRADLTVHGFRSTFRDWTAEQTNYPREVCEMALAHAVSDKVEAAYRRGDLFAKRVRLMEEWAKKCGTILKGARVIAIHRA
ncbi:MAG: integrase arm-type DNA-binding domain-containing protein [Alphaproteobacteria bacterium]